MKMKPTTAYRICGRIISFHSEEPIKSTRYFPLFQVPPSDQTDYTVYIFRKSLPLPEGDCVFSSEQYMQYNASNRVFRYALFPDAVTKTAVPYACAVHHGATIELYIDYPEALWDGMIFQALDLPNLLLKQQIAVVHASWILHQGAGIMFAGPKQIGKSTQARLWETHQHATVLNGDRVALYPASDQLTGFGLPFCGTSGICVNESHPVRAIIFPEKAPASSPILLSTVDAVKRLIGCISYEPGDPAASGQAWSITEKIAKSAPCILFPCRPDEQAVKILNHFILQQKA